jgi:branched-subunit amino acid ABC-type transport system permease component
MTPLLPYGLNTVEVAILYALVGCGFYLASTGARHFAFAAALGFLIAPYCALSVATAPGRIASAVAGLTACAAVGLAYRTASACLSRRGAGEGQLLIISLALLGIGSNVVAIWFGSESVTLATGAGALHLLGIRFAPDQLLVVLIGVLCLALVLRQWHGALVGKMLQALLESRLNLALRGINVGAIEVAATTAGFVLVGVAGLLWSVDGRVKPAMSIEIGVIGAVASIVGPMIRPGPAGLILASLGLAVIRTMLSLTLEGDWSMSAMLVLLAAALLLRGRNPIRIDAGS